MAQTAVPISTITLSNWSVTGAGSAHEALSDNSDSSYISTGLGGNEAECKFGPLLKPGPGNGTVTVKALDPGASGNTSINYRILEGTTARQTGSIPAPIDSDSPTDYLITFTQANMANVVDWTDIRLEIQRQGMSSLNAYEFDLSIPDPAAASGVIGGGISKGAMIG